MTDCVSALQSVQYSYVRVQPAALVLSTIYQFLVNCVLQLIDLCSRVCAWDWLPVFIVY